MPTESTFLFAGLLFLAAALGYVFARFGDLDEDDDPQTVARADFLRGFRYLLNEEPDRAVDVFTGVEAFTEEGLETQFALGALFRRRGELDRAIRMHQSLLDRPTLPSSQRDRATFALAEDFLAAGLFDRAEDLYTRLRDSPQFRSDALRRLLRVCEVTGDWARAIDICSGLQSVAPDSLLPIQLANYHCEMAEQARRAGRLEEADGLLDAAERAAPSYARIGLIRGDVARDGGDPRRALSIYAEVGRRQASMLSEILPRLGAVAEASGAAERLDDIIRSVATAGPPFVRALALAAVREGSIDSPALLECLRAFVDQQPVLRDLAGVAEGGGADARAQGLRRLRSALHHLAAPVAAYQCGNCGYLSPAMQWQCPGCRSWATIRATDRLLPGSSGL